MSKINLIIQKKQFGKTLTSREIEYVVNQYTSGKISDDIMTNWLKAIYHEGMNNEETLSYTQCMLNSGITLDFSYLNAYVIDKHSTGGVGDKVSFILGPILAVCGFYVPMLAGRGLEHTGGTIDKLESIPGYDVSLKIKDFKSNVEKNGISIMSQTDEICPADKKIYALRDMTKTVSSFPLICGSIMSKKIAEGIQGLLLDVKIGNGAFMKTLSDGKKLGGLLTRVGELYGIKVIPCYTNMDQPLGDYAGLWCEIMESIECLKGNGPDDLMELVYYLTEQAFNLSGVDFDLDRIKYIINEGLALDKFHDMVLAHGGSIESFENEKLNLPKFRGEIHSMETGYISFMDTRKIGMVLTNLCNGNDKGKINGLDFSAGIKFHKKIGNYIEKNEIVMEYFCSNKANFEKCKLELDKTFNVQIEKQSLMKLIYK